MNGIDLILKNEGGFVNDPDDNGGATNFGITQETLARWRGHAVTIDDVKNMTEQEAKDIYENEYLIRPKIGLLPQPIQGQILDIGVNSGPKTAIKMLQTTINLFGVSAVQVDGVIGPGTLRAVQETVEESGFRYLNNAIVEERIKFYQKIVQRNPSQQKFYRGWIKRAESFRL